jgi:uncharacterized protein (DUF1778 family)
VGKKATRAATERVDFRLDPEHKALIERAAAYQGETLTGYAVSTLVREALRVIQAHESVRLTDRDRDRFLEIVSNPSDPGDALHRAARRHNDLISGSE